VVLNGEAISVGAPARFLEVDIGNLGKDEVLEFLVTSGSAIRANWVTANGGV